MHNHKLKVIKWSHLIFFNMWCIIIFIEYITNYVYNYRFKYH